MSDRKSELSHPLLLPPPDSPRYQPQAYDHPISKGDYTVQQTTDKFLSMRLQSDTVDIVMHDLRQPLTLIHGYAAMAAMNLSDDSHPALVEAVGELNRTTECYFILYSKSMFSDKFVKGYDQVSDAVSPKAGEYPDNTVALAFESPLTENSFTTIVSFFGSLRQRLEPQLDYNTFVSEMITVATESDPDTVMIHLLAHELGYYQSHLSGVVGQLDLRMSHDHDDQFPEKDAVVIGLLDAVRSNNRRLDNFFKDIDMMLDTDKYQPQVVSGDPDFLTRQLVRQFTGQFNHEDLPHIEVKGHLPPSVDFDSRAFTFLMFNVLDNAWKYGVDAKDPKLHLPLAIELSESDENFLINVTDQGIGLDSKSIHEFNNQTDLAHRRFPNAKTSTIDGSGWGLYGARRRALRSGITLTASSEGLGKGSTFTISVPKQSIFNPSA